MQGKGQKKYFSLAYKGSFFSEKSKKVAIKFGRMKGNVYFCRQKVIKRNENDKNCKRNENDKNCKLLVVAQLKIRKIVRR